MILDKQNMFSEDQAVTVTADSTNIIDLGNDGSEVIALNEKGGVELLAQVTTAFAGGTSLKASLVTSDSSTFSSSTTVSESAVVLTAALVQGYKFRFASLPEINEQYAKLVYTVDGTMSAGNVVSALVLDKQTNV
jgi:hypothetical protein